MERQEKAKYDYIQASLIIRGFSIVMGSEAPFPSLQEVYPSLFQDEIQKEEEKVQERKDELSAIRFRQFAQSYNDNLKKEVPNKINE